MNQHLLLTIYKYYKNLYNNLSNKQCYILTMQDITTDNDRHHVYN